MGHPDAGDGGGARGAAGALRRGDVAEKSRRVSAEGFRRHDGNYGADVRHETRKRKQERADRIGVTGAGFVLSAERNRILTQVGPGTPMGDYLRRYWQPIGGAGELDANPIKAVRLLGEDLVLYKDLGGKYGLIDRHCPHRRADLSYGMVEETGIRCNYHGWLMDQAGNVIEQPYDDTVNPRGKARERCLAKAYPVKECAGLLFAYMGPQPAPELP